MRGRIHPAELTAEWSYSEFALLPSNFRARHRSCKPGHGAPRPRDCFRKHITHLPSLAAQALGPLAGEAFARSGPRSLQGAALPARPDVFCRRLEGPTVL